VFPPDSIIAIAAIEQDLRPDWSPCALLSASATCCAVTVSQANAVMAWRKLKLVSRATRRRTIELSYSARAIVRSQGSSVLLKGTAFPPITAEKVKVLAFGS